MAVELVTIVHPNGQKGVVAETYQPLVDGDLRRAPSNRSRDAQAAAEMPSIPAITETAPSVGPEPGETPSETPSDAPSTDTQE